MQNKSEREIAMSMPLPVLSQNSIEAWQGLTKLLQAMQAELLDGTRKLTSAWMERRQEALETGLRAFGEMAASKDPGSTTAICNNWIAGSMSRLTADMNDASDLWMRLAEIARNSTMDISRQAVEVGTKDGAGQFAASQERRDARSKIQSGDGPQDGRLAAG